jgi:hypothetical protein
MFNHLINWSRVVTVSVCLSCHDKNIWTHTYPYVMSIYNQPRLIEGQPKSKALPNTLKHAYWVTKIGLVLVVVNVVTIEKIWSLYLVAIENIFSRPTPWWPKNSISHLGQPKNFGRPPYGDGTFFQSLKRAWGGWHEIAIKKKAWIFFEKRIKNQ